MRQGEHLRPCCPRRSRTPAGPDHRPARSRETPHIQLAVVVAAHDATGHHHYPGLFGFGDQLPQRVRPGGQLAALFSGKHQRWARMRSTNIGGASFTCALPTKARRERRVRGHIPGNILPLLAGKYNVSSSALLGAQFLIAQGAGNPAPAKPARAARAERNSRWRYGSAARSLPTLERGSGPRRANHRGHLRNRADKSFVVQIGLYLRPSAVPG